MAGLVDAALEVGHSNGAGLEEQLEQAKTDKAALDDETERHKQSLAEAKMVFLVGSQSFSSSCLFVVNRAYYIRPSAGTRGQRGARVARRKEDGNLLWYFFPPHLLLFRCLLIRHPQRTAGRHWRTCERCCDATTRWQWKLRAWNSACWVWPSRFVTQMPDLQC
jgi:hypothetical protein